MRQIVKGVHEFRTHHFEEQRPFFERLASKQQKPRALFVTCADSRVHPNLITQTEPGDLFQLRNAGNIIPPYGATNGGEAATIEYAVAALGVKNIIVCGHSHCGAMQGLLQAETLAHLPSVSAWFKHAEATRQIVDGRHPGLEMAERVIMAAKENVLVQINNLVTHPVVAAKLALGELEVHGWYYEIESGRIMEFQPGLGWYADLEEQAHPVLPTHPGRTGAMSASQASQASQATRAERSAEPSVAG